MCGRYVIEIDDRELQSIVNEAQRRVNQQVKTGEIFPTNLAPVQILQDGEIVSTAMTWGFPRWDGKGVIINARQETAADKRTFKRPLMEKRAVIPTAGFFEWKRDESQAKKTKYLFRHPTGGILFLAGFYNSFDGQCSFCILTTAANRGMAAYHDRMPVLLDEAERRIWLRDDAMVPALLSRTPMDVAGECIGIG